MSHPRKFRFAAQLSKAPDGTARSWAEQAQKAEDLGYSTLLMPDHFGDQLAPVPALMAAAAATSTLRIGTLVFDNDYRHPGRPGQGGGHPGPVVGRPARARARRRLDAHRLRGVGHRLRHARGPGGPLRRGRGGHRRTARVRRALLVLGQALHRDRAHACCRGRRNVPVPRSSSGGGGRRVLTIAGQLGRHREHQRRPPSRDRRPRNRSQRLPRRHPSEGRRGSRRPPGSGSTTSSSTA